MRYNVSILTPADGSCFWRCFEDPALAVYQALNDKGHDVVSTVACILPDRHNVLLGWHNVEPGTAGAGWNAGIRWTAYQLEQLHKADVRMKQPVPWDTLELADAVWDYDEGNIEILKDRGIDAVHVPIGYRPEVRTRRDDAPEKDIDVLMFGCLRTRRKYIRDALAGQCNLQFIGTTSPLYGAELADVVDRAKVVVNVHYDGPDDYQEQARITPLLSQGACVASEASVRNYYGHGIAEAPLDGLVDLVLGLVADDDRRQRQADAGYDVIRAMPMEVPVAHCPG